MGIATSRIWSWSNRHRVTRLFGIAAIVFATAVSFATIPAAITSAQTVPSGQGGPRVEQFTWINDGIINEQSWVDKDGQKILVENVRYTDSNPNDTNRSFKSATVAPWCSNTDVARETISLRNSPALATHTYVETLVPSNPSAKVPCKMATREIPITNTQNATVQRFPCEGRAGSAQAECEKDAADGNAAFSRVCTSASTATLCTQTAPPGSATPGTDTNPTANADNKEPDPCDSLGADFSLSWIACPILRAASGTADGLDGLIEENMHYDTSVFNTTTAGGKGFYSAWSAFRAIALALVLIAGLIMVVSQGTGMQIVDAYMIRKILPRLLIAVIGITLSWELLELIITFFNDLGHWVQDLILLPFQSTAGGASNINGAGQVVGAGAALTAAILGAGAYLIRIGPPGLLALAGTVILALLVAWLVLVVRNVAITVIILFAPLAIACYILPNTKKVWDFWQNALVTMLMVFPIIMALLATGKAMSLVATEGIMKVLFFIAPYFFIPFAFKLAGGLMATIFSIANDRGRGGFDRMRNIRQNTAKQRMQDAKEGRNNNWVGRVGGRYSMGALARRAELGGFSPGQLFTPNGRAKYASAQRKYLNENAHKMVENDHGLASGDDDAMALALQRGMTRDQFVNSLANGVTDANGNVVIQGRGMAAARQALATTEAGLGARVGSGAMRVAAFKARAASGTGYAPGDYEQMARDAASLMNDGLITNAEGMAAFKANQKRADVNGVGSNTYLQFLNRSAERLRTNPNAPVVNAEEAADLRAEALRGSGPGMVVGGRHEAVTALAPQMLDNLNQAFASGDQVRIGRELAAVAGRYDAMSQVSPQNAEIMANLVMGQQPAGTGQYSFTNSQGQTVSTNLAGMNVHQIVEALRDDGNFRTMRREYGSAAAAQAGTVGAAAAAGTPGQTPPPGGQPVGSDRRLKKDIIRIGLVPGTDIPLYRFTYKLGYRQFVGVMAQDLLATHPEVVSTDKQGYYRVNYAALGTRMYTYEEWLALQQIARGPVSLGR